MVLGASRDLTRETTRVPTQNAGRDAHRRKRVRLKPPVVWDLAVVDILGAILRAFIFVARVPMRPRSHVLPTVHRWGA